MDNQQLNPLYIYNNDIGDDNMLDYIIRSEDLVIDVVDTNTNEVVHANVYKAYRDQSCVDATPYSYLLMNSMEFIGYEIDPGRIFILKPNETIVTRKPAKST